MKKQKIVNLLLCGTLAAGIIGGPFINEAMADGTSSAQMNGQMQSETQIPDTQAAEEEEPHLEKPDIEKPDTEVPDIETPGTEKPDTEVPDIETPGTEKPDPEKPDTEVPDIETPGTEKPDTEVPDIETSGTEKPDTEEPDTEASDTEMADAGQTSRTQTQEPAKLYTDGNTVVKAPIFKETDRSKLRQFKDLRLSRTQIQELISMTDGKMSEERLQVVLHAYSLVGKVNYFWGGKSSVIGWDEQWGALAVVTSEGSKSTGSTRPYGLDCSGYVTWTFLNAAGDAKVVSDIGHGTAAQWAASESVDETEALPGDLAFMAPGSSSDNHVGIVIGRNQDGQLMFAHCSSGSDNVVVTTAAKGGFKYLRRPDVYTEESLQFSEMVQKNRKAMTKENKELFEKYLDLSMMENEE